MTVRDLAVALYGKCPLDELKRMLDTLEMVLYAL